MSKSIYDQVTKHLNFYWSTYLKIQKTLTKSDFECNIKFNYDGELVRYEPIDRRKICFEFDHFKQEYPDDYKKYFDDFLSKYQMIYESFGSLFITDDEFEEVKLLVSNDTLLNTNPQNPQLIYLFWFKEDLAYIIDYLEGVLETENKNLKKEEKSIDVKGKTKLNRKQTALLFFYLREELMIAQPTNIILSQSISSITGHAAKQIKDILKKSGTPANELGKEDDKVTRADFKAVISELENLKERIKRDYYKYSDKNDLR